MAKRHGENAHGGMAIMSLLGNEMAKKMKMAA
jgi:hypothetical protein